MANEIINALVEEKIDAFLYAFDLSAKVLFRDDDKLNKLRHPGEFGIYREAIVRDFLHSFLPQRLAIDTGFVVNALGETSKQIDLVIYDPSLTPPLESRNRQRFFPIETVIAAGEVRSNIDRPQFAEGLLRVAQIKKMRSTLPSEASAASRWWGLSRTKYDPDRIPFDQVFTFLLCNRFEFNLRDDFVSTLRDVYKSVDYGHRHSAILSLHDGLMHYEGEFPEGEFADCSFPILPSDQSRNRNKWILGIENEYAHLKRFCADLFMHAAHCSIGSFNLTDYATTGKVNYLREILKSDQEPLP